ncbi:hypothetical protein PR048_004267 [Dryococelus australis]|uniref:Uncharacterized protein n=1 Tax=Dryococelus australis TaxID=614101 RepID=A0ABQ9I4Z8_9NEOP|nr:hypothetical protein PR048_004267 [Dryococelus australis]
MRKLNTISAFTRQKAKSKYRNRIWLERASRKQSSDTYKTPYDRVKRVPGTRTETLHALRVGAMRRLGVRVSVARIAPSLLDLGRAEKENFASSMTCALNPSVLCILEPQVSVHWLLPHTWELWDSQGVSLQVCYWFRGVQGRREFTFCWTTQCLNSELGELGPSSHLSTFSLSPARLQQFSRAVDTGQGRALMLKTILVYISNAPSLLQARDRNASAHEPGALSRWCNLPDLVKLSLHEAEEYPGSSTLAGLQKRPKIPRINYADGVTVAERLACSPPTKAIQVQSPAGSLRMWESCRTMPLSGGFFFSGISRFRRPFILVLLHTQFNRPHRLSRPRVADGCDGRMSEWLIGVADGCDGRMSEWLIGVADGCDGRMSEWLIGVADGCDERMSEWLIGVADGCDGRMSEWLIGVADGCDGRMSEWLIGVADGCDGRMNEWLIGVTDGCDGRFCDSNFPSFCRTHVLVTRNSAAERLWCHLRKQSGVLGCSSRQSKSALKPCSNRFVKYRLVQMQCSCAVCIQLRTLGPNGLKQELA